MFSSRMDNFKFMVIAIILFIMTILFCNKNKMDLTKENTVIDEPVLKEVPIVDKSFEKIPLEQLMKGPYLLSDDHPYLIQHIQTSLVPPSVLEGYKLRNPMVLNPSHGCQTQAIRNILGEMKGGFFVEAGAVDGEFFSNTLIFERDYGWKGLLVEANPENMVELLMTQRKAWSINTCMSTKPHPYTVQFILPSQDGIYSKGQGKIEQKASAASERSVTVQCVPMYSILMALNTSTVDYFSLDIEGSELDVLMTIPWDKLNIRTLTVEFQNIPAGKDALQKYMESVGYNTYAETGSIENKPVDYVFYKKDIIPVVKPPKSPMLC